MQGEWITYTIQHGDYIWLSTSTSNTCADPGIFARGAQARLPENSSDVFFRRPQLILQFYGGLSMIYLKETIIFRGVQHFQGQSGGGGGGLNANLYRTHRICDFQGVRTPYLPSGSAHVIVEYRLSPLTIMGRIVQ